MNTNLSGTVKMTAIAEEDLDSVVFELFPSYTINTILFNLDTAKYSWRKTGIHCKVDVKKGEKFTFDKYLRAIDLQRDGKLKQGASEFLYCIKPKYFMRIINEIP
jgi:hypothetical protein